MVISTTYGAASEDCTVASGKPGTKVSVCLCMSVYVWCPVDVFKTAKECSGSMEIAGIAQPRQACNKVLQVSGFTLLETIYQS